LVSPARSKIDAKIVEKWSKRVQCSGQRTRHVKRYASSN
jgi:hypothetical protein